MTNKSDGKPDDRVAQYNDHVRAMIKRNAEVLHRDRPFDRRAEIRVHGNMLDKHQPEGGQHGGVCAGGHEQPETWPCELIRYLASVHGPEDR